MRWELWLADPGNGRWLRSALRLAAFVCALWLVLVVGGLWGSRRALAYESAALAARRRQLTEEAATMHRERVAAGRADRLHLDEPERASAAVASEFEQAARAAGVDLVSQRIIPVDQPAAAQAPPSGSPAAAGPPTAAPDLQWHRATVECTAVGPYGSLQRFLDHLVGVERVLDITGVQMGRSAVAPARGSVQVQLKMTAALYGLGSRP